jgi:hypothetical protein
MKWIRAEEKIQLEITYLAGTQACAGVSGRRIHGSTSLSKSVLMYLGSVLADLRCD